MKLSVVTFDMSTTEFPLIYMYKIVYSAQISTEAEGKEWSEETSSARNYVSYQPSLKLNTSSSSSSLDRQAGSGGGGGANRSYHDDSYQSGPGSQDLIGGYTR